jgi:hypothetical protein
MPHWLTLLIAVIPAVATVVGGFWTLSTYLQDKADEQKRTIDERILQLKKPFFDKRLEIYIRTTKVTSKFITSPDEKGNAEWRSMWDEFWQLYIVEMPLVENDAVKMEMRAFGQKLNAFVASGIKPDYDAMKSEATELSSTMREDIESSWSLK